MLHSKGRIQFNIYNTLCRNFTAIACTIFFTVSELTIEASTGKKSVAVATLLVHSVKVAISRHMMIAIAHGGMFCSGAI